MFKIKPKQKEPQTMWAFRYPVADMTELKRIAKKEKVSVSELARQVLEHYIQDYKKAEKG